jgi:hypothetical protein
MKRPTIARTVSIQGVTIPGIIQNGNFFSTDLEVYADGLIYCWEMVDFALLKQRIQQKWLVPSVPDGSSLHIHNVGDVCIESGDWIHDTDSLAIHIESVVRQMNPGMENLFNCHGRSVKEVNGVRYAWPEHGTSRACKFEEPFTPFANKVYGNSISHIVKVEDRHYLANIRIFEDGQVVVSGLPEDETYDFAEFMHLLETDVRFASPAIGATLAIDGLGEFVVGWGSEFIDPESLRGEIEDVYDRVQGRLGKIQCCMNAYEHYCSDPSSHNLDNLRMAYEVVPDHLKMYCGDMDSKDNAIRFVLYGEEEFEE